MSRKKPRHISHIRMSEGAGGGVGGRFSGGGRGAVCHATPPLAPLTRSGSDQNTTSHSSNRAGEGASCVKLTGLEGSDPSDQNVTSEASERCTSRQVVETGEKKGLSPGGLTGSSVLERAGSSGQGASGQLIGKPAVTLIQSGEVAHIGEEERLILIKSVFYLKQNVQTEKSLDRICDKTAFGVEQQMVKDPFNPVV